MYRFTHYTQWIISIFSFFCLVQVRSWFDEIIDSYNDRKNSFTWGGLRYSIMPNRAFIVDQSLEQYGIKVNFHELN